MGDRRQDMLQEGACNAYDAANCFFLDLKSAIDLLHLKGRLIDEGISPVDAKSALRLFGVDKAHICISERERCLNVDKLAAALKRLMNSRADTCKKIDALSVAPIRYSTLVLKISDIIASELEASMSFLEELGLQSAKDALTIESEIFDRIAIVIDGAENGLGIVDRDAIKTVLCLR